MRKNRNWVDRMLGTAAILICILASVSEIAAEPSVNEQLLQAAENGSLEQIKDLLAKGGDINAKNKEGEPVLMFAAEEGDLGVVKFLIDKGADMNAKDKNGRTAVTYACWFRDQPEVVQYLKARGAK